MKRSIAGLRRTGWFMASLACLCAPLAILGIVGPHAMHPYAVVVIVTTGNLVLYWPCVLKAELQQGKK